MGKTFLRLLWHFLRNLIQNAFDNLFVKPVFKAVWEWVCSHSALVIGLLIISFFLDWLFDNDRTTNNE